jgi:hypothetical protein
MQKLSTQHTRSGSIADPQTINDLHIKSGLSDRIHIIQKALEKPNLHRFSDSDTTPLGKVTGASAEEVDTVLVGITVFS